MTHYLTLMFAPFGSWDALQLRVRRLMPIHTAIYCCLVFAPLICAGCYVPSADDADRAYAIGRFIDNYYGMFNIRTEVDRMHVGKIYYTRPGRQPQILLYEVTDPTEIARIETIARRALEVNTIPSVELIFYEKQNWQFTKNGGGSRGAENVIKRIIISREAAT